MTQIHDTGEEYIMKNPINTDFNVGLYNAIDNLDNDDDISNISTEPQGSNYQRQTASFSAEDKGGNWEMNNDDFIVFDTSDSDAIIDGYFLTKVFQSDDKGDSSPQEHLIATGDFDELVEPGGPESGIQAPRINLNDGTTNMTNVRIRPRSAGIALDNTLVFEGLEDGVIPNKIVDSNQIEITDSPVFNGNFSLYTRGPEDGVESAGSPRWRWAFDDGEQNEIQRFDVAYQHLNLSRDVREFTQDGSTLFYHAAGDVFDFEDLNGDIVLRVVMRALSDDILVEDSRGLNEIFSNVSFFNDGDFLTMTIIIDYINYQYRMILRDAQDDTQLVSAKTRGLKKQERIAFIAMKGWSDNDELAANRFNSASSNIVDDLSVYLS